LSSGTGRVVVVAGGVVVVEAGTVVEVVEVVGGVFVVVVVDVVGDTTVVVVWPELAVASTFVGSVVVVVGLAPEVHAESTRAAATIADTPTRWIGNEVIRSSRSRWTCS